MTILFLSQKTKLELQYAMFFFVINESLLVVPLPSLQLYHDVLYHFIATCYFFHVKGKGNFAKNVKNITTSVFTLDTLKLFTLF
jgi:hypothetical protein